ncbi:hypothetical protein ACHQM5_003821 [Ranunculus cassubicifolius]
MTSMAVVSSSSPSSSSSSSFLNFPITNISNHVKVECDSETYLLWRDQFNPVLICNDLLGYVDGSIPQPAKTIVDQTTQKETANPAYKTWLIIDQFLLSCIKATLTRGTRAHVLGLQTSKAVF